MNRKATVKIFHQDLILSNSSKESKKREEWKKRWIVDYYRHLPKLKAMNDILKNKLVATWPFGFQIDNWWMKQWEWGYNGSDCAFLCSYKTH